MHEILACGRKVTGSIPDSVTVIFLLTRFFRPYYGSGVDAGLTILPPSCADCLEIFLEPSGPVQACTGIASPLYEILNFQDSDNFLVGFQVMKSCNVVSLHVLF